MMRWRCLRESDTARAARTGEWPEQVRAHTADCPVCRDVALVAGVVDVRRNLPAEPPMAAAGRVWWMAQLRARRAAAERALRPTSVMGAAGNRRRGAGCGPRARLRASDGRVMVGRVARRVGGRGPRCSRDPVGHGSGRERYACRPVAREHAGGHSCRQVKYNCGDALGALERVRQ